MTLVPLPEQKEPSISFPRVSNRLHSGWIAVKKAWKARATVMAGIYFRKSGQELPEESSRMKKAHLLRHKLPRLGPDRSRIEKLERLAGYRRRVRTNGAARSFSLNVRLAGPHRPPHSNHRLLCSLPSARSWIWPRATLALPWAWASLLSIAAAAPGTKAAAAMSDGSWSMRLGRCCPSRA